jgi:hypothetical protein
MNGALSPRTNGGIDLDDVGTVVGQQHRAVWAGQVAGQVQNQKVIKCAGHDVCSIAFAATVVCADAHVAAGAV